MFTEASPTMKIYVSEYITDPLPTNSTWVFNGNKKILINPAEIMRNKQQKERNKKQIPSFNILYFKFITEEDCQFSADVFFPIEDEKILEERNTIDISIAEKPNDLRNFEIRNKVINKREAIAIK